MESRHQPLTKEVRKKVLRKLEMGLSPSEISKELNIRVIQVIDVMNKN